MKPVLCISTGTLLLVAAVSAIPQQAVPPPPRPADSGPSLEATMQYIQQKLNAIGTVTYIMPWQNTQDGSSGTHKTIEEFSQITADASNCRVSYHQKVVSDGQVLHDQDISFPLKEARDVAVEPIEQAMNAYSAKGGQPELVTPAGSVNPPVTMLRVRLFNDHGGFFPFLDASDADRTARAITHAIELCGGGSKELF